MPSGSWVPAAYGYACAGCVRGKCKCMLRENGPGCERCHRLGKPCEPSGAVRKRKSRSPQPPNLRQQSDERPNPAASDNDRTTCLEEKLEALVSLLQTQTEASLAPDKRRKRPTPEVHEPTGPGLAEAHETRTLEVREPTRPWRGPVDPALSGGSLASTSTGATAAAADAMYARARINGNEPDLVMSTGANTIQFVRPIAHDDPVGGGKGRQSSSAGHSSSRVGRSGAAAGPISPLAKDIQSAREKWREGVRDQDRLLDTFRDTFIPVFPFVRLPGSLSAAELCRQKPFLWLVIMALTQRSVATQFAMEETIWSVISRRIVVDQLADLDLLLGLVCFANWSHTFKKEKPFATTVSHLAVSMAMELNLHRENSSVRSFSTKFGRVFEQSGGIRERTMEERRTILAVFHLTSTVWDAYRKAEPMAWTPYLDSCAQALSQGRDTDFDVLLAIQVRCQTISNQLSCPSLAGEASGTDAPGLTSNLVAAALLGQLGEVRQSVPDHLQSVRAAQLWTAHAELAIKSICLNRTKGPQQSRTASVASGIAHTRRIQDLEATLTACEGWLAAFEASMEPIRWIAAVDLSGFSQMMHCLVILFRLRTLPPEDGDLVEEVKRRADVFQILDHLCDEIAKVPAAYGMVNADGPRKGLFFKAAPLLRIVKQMMTVEFSATSEEAEDFAPRGWPSGYQHSEGGTEGGLLPPAPLSAMDVTPLELLDDGLDGFNTAHFASDLQLPFPDDYVFDEESEPWISDLLGTQWSAATQSFYYVPDPDGY